jgi:Flp pilus assembly CpaE family ATPase
VPSDFKTVAESINLGVPIHQHAKGSSVTKALKALEQKIAGVENGASKGILGRAFASLLGKEKWA